MIFLVTRNKLKECLNDIYYFCTLQKKEDIIFWKMLKAQLKFNFGPTFLLSLKKITDLEERESLQLERE